MPATAAKKQTISSVTPTQNMNPTTTPENLEKEKFSVYMQKPAVQESLLRALGDAKLVNNFSKALVLAVTSSTNLASCTYPSIVSAALRGSALNLSSNETIGQYYIVPYNGKAQLQIGWKGYYQLAIRSNMYKTLDVSEIKEGELKSYNPITKEAEFEPILDDEEREKKPTIGYYTWFELKNGFKKSLYWPKAKMEAHAEKYSKAYKAKKGISFWEKDFDSMAKKTMLRQLLSKYGPMSEEMEIAMETDMSASEDLGKTKTYVDNDSGEIIEE